MRKFFLAALLGAGLELPAANVVTLSPSVPSPAPVGYMVTWTSGVPTPASIRSGTGFERAARATIFESCGT